MKTLVESSPTTLRWLAKIRREVEEKSPSLKYSESGYWAYFKSKETGRNVVQLNPRGKYIRLFTKLDLTADKDLKQTPSSSGWAELYPSTFSIRSEDAIDNAVKFIIGSHEIDRRL